MPLNAVRRKKLIKLVPENVIITRSYLRDNGFQDHAIDNLVKSIELNVLWPGVYYRGTKPTSWQSIVYSLQFIMNLDLAVGGLTALELKGYHHYVPLSKKKIVHLYGTHSLPRWLKLFVPEIQFVIHNSVKLFDTRETSSKLFTVSYSWTDDDKKILISDPGRAFLEVLLDVPKISFEHAIDLMQQLTSLSPGKTQKLLELCVNIKATRLFLWLSERQNYSWFKKINTSRINLGSGNRLLAKRGKLNKKYMITVPKDYV